MHSTFEHTFENIAVASLARFNALASLEISRILKKKKINKTSSLYFKKLNKGHHGTAYKRTHVRNPYSFTD